MRTKIGISILFLLLACETLFEIELACILVHTTQVVKMESDLLGEREDVFINLIWSWIYETPSGDAVVVERSIGDSTNFAPIDTLWGIDSVMYYTDNDSILNANSLVYYKLAFFDGQRLEYFKTTSLTVPASQHFYEPSTDTLTDTLLHITYTELPDFGSCSIAVYKGISTDLESLVNFIDPLFDTTLTYPDTTIVISLSDTTIYPNLTLYTIKLFSSNSILTRTSFGFRAFFKIPEL